MWGGRPGNVVVHRSAAVEEDNDADHRGGDKHLRVYPQPGEVEAYLLTKVLPERRPGSRLLKGRPIAGLAPAYMIGTYMT